MKIGKEKLKQFITETVRKVLNEGHYSNEILQKWEDTREALGDDTFIMELWNEMDSTSIEEFLDRLNRQHDLGFDEEESEEE